MSGLLLGRGERTCHAYYLVDLKTLLGEQLSTLTLLHWRGEKESAWRVPWRLFWSSSDSRESRSSGMESKSPGRAFGRPRESRVSGMESRVSRMESIGPAEPARKFWVLGRSDVGSRVWPAKPTRIVFLGAVFFVEKYHFSRVFFKVFQVTC